MTHDNDVTIFLARLELRQRYLERRNTYAERETRAEFISRTERTE